MSLSDRLLQTFGVKSLQAACEAAADLHLPARHRLQPGDPLKPVAESVGLKIVVGDSDRYEGSLTWESSGQGVVTISHGGSAARQRFTLAHELGHWVLQQSIGDPQRGPLFRGLSSSRAAVRDEEKLANLMGAEILMPGRAVRNVVKDSGICLQSVAKISKLFFVSRIAAMRRLADISEKHLLYINVVPRDFKDLTSVAEVDDAVYVRPGRGTLLARDSTKFAESCCYYNISSAKKFHGAFNGVDGRIHAVFDVRSFLKPIPNADLLMVSDVTQD